MLVFIGAVRREIAGLEPLVSDPETERFGSAVVVEGTADGRPVALIRSGIGRERSESAVRDLLLAHVRPRAIVSLGFAGGVAPDVYGGDLVVPPDHSRLGLFGRSGRRHRARPIPVRLGA